MPQSEYVGISQVTGPFILLEDAGSDAFFGELVDVRVPGGVTRRGRIVSLSEGATLVQVFSGTDGLIPNDTRVRLLGRTLQVQLAPSIIGRTFNGLGEPADGCGPVFGGRRADANGMPLNPMARQYPKDFIHTGISSIDTLTTLIRGQKLPIFSGNGLPHNQLAVQIATQARLMGSENFAVVFAGIGIKHDDAEFLMRELSEKGRTNNVVTYLNLADDPVIERIATPRMALSAAEYMAYELGLHVLVIITDMTSYCEAVRELGVAAGEVPSRKGYPAYLYSDLASLYERAGVVRGLNGSVTQLPILTMPNDDITHPIPDLTGFITEGQIVLSRDLDGKGIYPPIDVLTSLSRLMKDGIGKGFTRDDHPNLASQLFASYSHVQDVRSLAGVVGEDELSKTDKQSLAFGGLFENKFLKQGKDEDREIGQSLDMAWDILSSLPKGDLTRVSLDEIKAHIKNQ
ncbi:MAG: V-type ATP synthase subunit B [Synergistaceae bacterium]|jgi:V/A-type H+-transporting ATPase subunit B|nr:V-type ATP synthase subunit B [Synergistaceae bacterium]